MDANTRKLLEDLRSRAVGLVPTWVTDELSALLAAPDDVGEAVAARRRELNIKYNEGYKDGKAFAAARQQEPAGKIVAGTGSLNDLAVIQWTGNYRPQIGDLIFAAAPDDAPAHPLGFDPDIKAVIAQRIAEEE